MTHPLLWINGITQKGQETLFETVNPSTGEKGFSFYQASELQINEAFESAHLAQNDWEALGFEKRWNFLNKWQQNLLSKKEKLLFILQQETGKATWDAESELQAFFNKWPITAKAYHELIEKPQDFSIEENLSYKSLGVFSVLGPFNYPLHLPNGQILPVLASGGCVVFKPSELTSALAHLYLEAAYEIGMPKGVLNMILGKGHVGEAIIKHPLSNGVLFTGSSKVGHSIYNSLSQFPDKLIALEMGGCNPLVVSGTQEAEASSSILIQSAFATTGQRCSCARRLILIESPEARKVLKTFIEQTQKLQIGAFSDKETSFMGPLIRSQAVQEVLDFQKRLIARGGQILLESKALERKGHWISPGIIELPSNQLIGDEECFGPLLQVTWVENLEKAIEVANTTTMGLTASLLSESKSEFDQFLRQIQAGVINWNEPTTGASSKLPFGGIKGSGNHRPSGYFMISSCVFPIASKTSSQIKKITLPGLKP